MKRILPFLFLFAVSAVGQAPDLATGTYAQSGRLISVTNLIGLSDCDSSNVIGKVSKVKVRGNMAYFRVQAKDEKKTVEISLDRLSSGERAMIFRDLVKTGVTVRVAGYSCGSAAIISAFSIDRVWGIDPKKATSDVKRRDEEMTLHGSRYFSFPSSSA
ncbi:MAG: hypothetical protein ABIU09_07800 [Pyrinomonadaceae bacterium]